MVVAVPFFFFSPRNECVVGFWIDGGAIFFLREEVPNGEHEGAVFFKYPFYFFEAAVSELFVRQMVEHRDHPYAVKRAPLEGEFARIGYPEVCVQIFFLRNADHLAAVINAGIVDGVIFQEVRETTIATSDIEELDWF